MDPKDAMTKLETDNATCLLKSSEKMGKSTRNVSKDVLGGMMQSARERAAGEDVDECVKISEMTMNRYCSVYGIVVDWLECRESRGSDFVMTLDLIDETTTNRLSVKIFSRTKIFKEGFCIGDVVRIRHLKLYDVGRAITDHKNDIEVVYSGLCPSGEGAGPRVLELVAFFMANKYKFTRERSVSEIGDNQYFDFHGELVDKQIERHNLVILRFVDYTSNPRVKNPESNGMYPGSMVLLVKAWGAFARLAEDCEVGGLYKIKNLRIDEIGGHLTANLSESRKGNILKTSRNAPISHCLELRKRMYERYETPEVLETPDRMLEYKVVEIKDICVPGIHRVQVRVKQHTPFRGMEFLRCKVCNLVKKGISDFQCKCTKPVVESIRLLKLLVCDNSGEAVVVCKNKLAECILGEDNADYLNGRFFDGLVASIRSADGIAYHLIDMGFYKGHNPKLQECPG